MAVLSAALTLAACGGDSESSIEFTTTTAATVEINMETLSSEEEAILASVMDSLRDEVLTNKTVKWLSHYDLNPDNTGQSRSVALEMFEAKYGGIVEYYPTTWDTRFNDLSVMVVGGEGIDIFPGADPGHLPRGIVNGMFQPVDPYISMDSPLWQQVKRGMELYKFGDNHYQLVTQIIAEAVVIYNRETIEANGFEDPYSLWRQGRWDWDMFRSMLLDFCDAENDQHGLDGYWSEKALMLSAGVPLAGLDENNKLVCNINDRTLERAMIWQRALFQDGLVFQRELFQYNEQPQFMGEGRQLFYISGIWQLNGAPSTWRVKIDPLDVMIAPVPSPAGSVEFQGARLEGYVLCKGAANPLGAALLAECNIMVSLDENALAIADRKRQEDSQWSNEMIRANNEINELARLNPVLELSAGISPDFDELTGATRGDHAALRAPMRSGADWASIREEYAGALIMLLEDVASRMD